MNMRRNGVSYLRRGGCCGLVGCLAVVFSVAVPVYGQDAGARIEGYDKVQRADAEKSVELSPEKPEKPDDDTGVKDGASEQDPRKLVETVMMVRLTEELQLSDEETVVMVRRLRDLKDKMFEMRKGRGDLFRALKDTVDSGASDELIQKKLDELLDYDRKLESFKQDHLDDVSEGLTTAQRAKLYIFMSEFESDMRRLIHQAQERADGRRRDGDWRQRDGDTPCQDGSGDCNGAEKK